MGLSVFPSLYYLFFLRYLQFMDCLPNRSLLPSPFPTSCPTNYYLENIYMLASCKPVFRILQKVLSRKTLFYSFFLASWRSMMKTEGSGSISQRHGSADPDPHQNDMDPEHCCKQTAYTIFILSIIYCTVQLIHTSDIWSHIQFCTNKSSGVNSRKE